jgi:hypothetical protein
LGVEVGDGGRTGTATEMGLEFVEVGRGALCHDLHAAVGPVLRITDEIEGLCLAPDQPAKADALHNSSRHGTQSRMLVQGIPLPAPEYFIYFLFSIYRGTAGYIVNSDEDDGLSILLGAAARLMR